MYSEDDILAKFSLNTLQYLRKKHEGGSNNLKGNSYENHFTVYKIACLSADVIEGGQNIVLWSQILAFVDDLIIDYAGRSALQHFQLKSGQSVSWGEGDKSISSDFSDQKKLNDSRARSSQITLVVSSPELKQTLEEKIPANIKDYSQIAHFHYAPSINAVLDREPHFQQVVQYLCAVENATKDKLETVSAVLLGAWVASGKSGISVMEILEKAQQHSPSYIRIFGPEPELNPQLKDVLDNIPNFQYKVSKGFLHWEFGGGIDKGTFTYSCETLDFRRFEERIKVYQPTSFDELENLL
jgi:hypothetical protein